MKTNVRVLDKKFIVNNRTIICLMRCSTGLRRSEFPGVRLSQFPYVVIATSKTTCSPNDKFDEALGKKIAETKAMKKVFAQVWRHYKNLLFLSHKQEDAIKNKILALSTAAQHENNHLNWLIYGDENGNKDNK